jgi:aminodeoxyfutalosine deaminase
MILRAKLVVPVSQPPIDDGAVVVEGDSIVAVGPTNDVRAQHAGDVRDLGEVALSPGLINAHCHLDYTRMRGEVEWRGSFIEWILQLVALKKLRSEKEYAAAIELGADQLLKTGTTTVVNIELFPAVIDQFGEIPQRVIWCLELSDYGRTDVPQDIAQRALEFIAARPNLKFGLSPHAPYTVSAELYRLAGRYAKARNIPLTTHLAESQEEDDMIRRGSGHMYDYFLRAGRDMGDCKRVGAVQLLAEYGALGPNCLAAHANCLTPLDVKLLAETGTHVVHCPKTHRFFGRDTPLLGSLKQYGVNFCLGTDSLASNDTLNMFEEMQVLARIFPRMSAEEILPMATINAARALNQPEKLGKIAPGAWADLIAVPLDAAVVDPYEAVVFAEKPVSFSMIAGKAVIG